MSKYSIKEFSNLEWCDLHYITTYRLRINNSPLHCSKNPCFLKVHDPDLAKSRHTAFYLDNVELGCGKCQDQKDCIEWDVAPEKTYIDVLQEHNYKICRTDYAHNFDVDDWAKEVCKSDIKDCYVKIHDNIHDSKGGCGKCNNEKNCRDCNKFDCSTPDSLRKGLIFCYERKYGQINKENKCTTSSTCYISVDFSKSK
uniref:Uncharacterized protein n=1 Tax=Meloidogyne javanica TaxID=6303 RepID=A0A915N8E3_MELJA